MRLIEILALDNGAHRNYTIESEAPIPEGWAVIPEEMESPETFPFVDVVAKDVDGVMTVTSMTAGVMPEPEPEPEPAPSPTERIDALEKDVADLTTAIEKGLSL